MEGQSGAERAEEKGSGKTAYIKMHNKREVYLCISLKMSNTHYNLYITREVSKQI